MDMYQRLRHFKANRAVMMEDNLLHLDRILRSIPVKGDAVFEEVVKQVKEKRGIS